GLLRDDGRVHVHDFAFALRNLLGGFCQEHLAGRAFPARVGVREKMADVRLAERAEKRVANRVHERVRVRMAVQAFGVRNLDAAEDEFASRDQRMNVVANANVNHAVNCRNSARRKRRKIKNRTSPAYSPNQKPSAASSFARSDSCNWPSCFLTRFPAAEAIARFANEG